jgi:hypothetical protein
MGKESRFFLLKKRGAVAIQLSDSADSTKNFATKKKMKIILVFHVQIR